MFLFLQLKDVTKTCRELTRIISVFDCEILATVTRFIALPLTENQITIAVNVKTIDLILLSLWLRQIVKIVKIVNS